MCLDREGALSLQKMGDHILRISHEVVDKNDAGFAMDIGGSLAKIVYRSKDDYENGQPKFNEPLGRLRTKLFPAEKKAEIPEFLQKHCDIHQTDGIRPRTCSTGMNHKDKSMEKYLGIQLTADQELDCFVRAFRHLLTHQPESLFDELPDQGLDKARARTNMLKNIQEDFSKASEGDMKPGPINNNDGEGDCNGDCNGNNNNERQPALPCLLAMAGSGIGFVWVKSDGSWQIVDGTPLGGRYFLGMANLLTGEKSYERVIEMAGRGCADRVHMHTKDMRVEAGGGYEAYPADLLLYFSGKAATNNRDEFRPEDRVASLLSATCYTVVQLLHYQATMLGVKNIYLCGNFVSSDVVRVSLTEESVSRAELFQPDPSKRVQTRFLKKGGFFGALGAYMKSVDDSPPKAED